MNIGSFSTDYKTNECIYKSKVYLSSQMENSLASVNLQTSFVLFSDANYGCQKIDRSSAVQASFAHKIHQDSIFEHEISLSPS